MQSIRAVHPALPLALSNKYAVDSRLIGPPEATESVSRAALQPPQPPDGVLSRDFGQFSIDTVQSSYYQRNQSSTDHLNPLAPPLHPALAQAPTDPSLFQHQNQVTTEASLFRQQIRHLPAEASPFCHQSEQSQFQAATGTPAFLPNQNQVDAAVIYQHQSQLSTEPALYQRSSEQSLYHHSNQPAPETSLYHHSQNSADNSLYQHPNQRLTEAAVFRDPHQAISEGSLYHQSLEATMFQGHRPPDASVFHHVNQATAEASLFHPNHPSTDAAVYHSQEAALYHHQNSLSSPASNFLHQSSSAPAPQAPAFYHQTPAAPESSNIFRFPSQSGDAHYQRQSQLNPPFFHLQNQPAVETQYHHQQNMTEPPFHVLQNQRPVESQLHNSGPVDTAFYPHRNVDMVETHHCQQSSISTEAQVFQFQNQPAQDSQLHQHSRVPSDGSLYQYQGQVASETQLHQQNHSTIDVSMVSYQNHMSQEPQILHRSHADMSVYHYPNQVGQDLQLSHQTQGSTEASPYHFQNQTSLGTLHPSSIGTNKLQSHRHQKLVAEEGLHNLTATRFHPRPTASSSDGAESTHYVSKRSSDSYVSSRKTSVDLSDMQRVYGKDASKAGNIPVTGALLSEPNYNIDVAAKPNNPFNIKERPETHFSWQKNRKGDSNICQRSSLYCQIEDEIEKVQKRKDHVECKMNSVLQVFPITKPSGEEIEDELSVDARSPHNTQSINSNIVSTETYESNVSNVSHTVSSQGQAEADVLSLDHTISDDGMSSKMQPRGEQHSNKYKVIPEPCEESASNQIDDTNTCCQISTDEKKLSETTFNTNQAFHSDPNDEKVLSLKDLVFPPMHTECAEAVSVCHKVTEEVVLVSLDDNGLHQSPEKSSEAITLCNAHLLPRPPDILLTLPITSESDNTPSQLGINSGELSTQAPHSSHDGSDESGPLMGLLFEESNSSPSTPPLMTPPCVTPPPSSPPRNWSSTSPMSCSPSSPKYATPAFLSPLSSSPRADEVEPLVAQNDHWDQSQAKTYPVQGIKSGSHSICSIADAIDMLTAVVANSSPSGDPVPTSSSSFLGRILFSTEESSEIPVAGEPDETSCSLPIKGEVDKNLSVVSATNDPMIGGNPTCSSGLEGKMDSYVGFTDGLSLLPSSEDNYAPVKSNFVLETADMLKFVDISKPCSQSSTVAESEPRPSHHLSDVQYSTLFKQSLPLCVGQIDELESHSQERSTSSMLSIPPMVAVATSDTASIDSPQTSPLALSQSLEESVLDSAIEPVFTTASLMTASKCDEKVCLISRSSDFIQSEEHYSNSGDVALTDDYDKSSMKKNILKDGAVVQETLENRPQTDNEPIASVSSLDETEIPPGSISTEQELAQVDDAMPVSSISSRSANQPQGAPPGPIIVSGFLTTQQCLKL